MLILTIEQIRELDRLTTEKYDIPSFLLMENAGRGLADSILNVLSNQPNYTQILFFCGGGNNAGDGFVAARHLFQERINLRVYLLTPETTFKGDTQVNFQILKNLGISIQPFSQFRDDKKSNLRNIPLVAVDALLGTGFKGGLRPDIAEGVRQINDLKQSHNAKVTVVAVDIPSGLNGNNGTAGKDTIKANRTVTFAFNKTGLAKPLAKYFVGKLDIIDIGIPDELVKQVTGKDPHHHTSPE